MAMSLKLMECYYATLWNFVDFVYVKYSDFVLTSNVHHVETHCHYVRLHVKELLFLPDFNQTSTVSTNVGETHKHKFSRKSVHWERSCSIQTDRQTEKHDQLNRRFPQLCLKQSACNFTSQRGGGKERTN